MGGPNGESDDTPDQSRRTIYSRGRLANVAQLARLEGLITLVADDTLALASECDLRRRGLRVRDHASAFAPTDLARDVDRLTARERVGVVGDVGGVRTAGNLPDDGLGLGRN